MSISVEENVLRCCAKFGVKISDESLARRRRAASSPTFTKGNFRRVVAPAEAPEVSPGSAAVAPEPD